MSDLPTRLIELPYEQLKSMRDTLNPIFPAVQVRNESVCISMASESQRLFMAFNAGRRSVVDDMSDIIKQADERAAEGSV